MSVLLKLAQAAGKRLFKGVDWPEEFVCCETAG
jgi:hypothetical protein